MQVTDTQIIDALPAILPKILDIARYAPSVHNTQPWRVSTSHQTIIIDIDPLFKLHDGDPTGRQTTISLGIFCEAIRLGAAANGLQTMPPQLKSNGATIIITGEREKTPDINREVLLLRKRSTDRSIFQPINLSTERQTIINSCPLVPGTSSILVTDPEIINVVATLTTKGIRLALSNPAFRTELSTYLVHNRSHEKRGISLRSLYIPSWLALMEPWLLRNGIGLNAEAKLEYRRWQSASGIFIVLADGDLAKYWLSAGSAYLHASLAIEAQGLSQATSAAIVEASNYHEDIEALLHTNQRILAIIRVGKGSKKRYYSPRLEPADLITSN